MPARCKSVKRTSGFRRINTHQGDSVHPILAQRGLSNPRFEGESDQENKLYIKR